MIRLIAYLIFASSMGSAQLLAQAGSVSKNGSARPSRATSKQAAFSPERYRPDAEVPMGPERYIWKLSTKRSTLAKNSSDVPVYAFDQTTSVPFSVGSAKVGEVITLEEFRLASGRNFYKFKWTGSVRDGKFLGRNPTFWVDGLNIDFAGKN